MNEVISGLVGGFEDAVAEDSHGQDVVRLPAGQLLEFGNSARKAGFDVCVDVTAVDWLGVRRPRFDIVFNFLSTGHELRLRVIVAVEEPKVSSLTEVWPGVAFAEREVYDMFGVEFEGHPDLSRILMPDDWVGHPLLKDYALGSVPVQFKDSHKVS